MQSPSKRIVSVRQRARYDAGKTPAQPTVEPLSPLELKLEERFKYRAAILEAKRERALRAERVSVIANDLTTGATSFDDLLRDTVDKARPAAVFTCFVT